MLGSKQRLYARFALQLGVRFRWRIWRNYLHYRWSVARVRSGGPDRLGFTPPNVVIWVTNRCNKDCHFCQYAEGLNAVDHRELELTLERFRELVALPWVRNCLRLSLYGGEPLLNAQLPEMISHGKRQGHLVSLTTNGLLIKKRLPDLLQARPDLIAISYYPEDRVRTDEAIGLVAPHLPVVVKYMYSEARLDEIEEVVECAARHRVRAVELETYDVQGVGSDWMRPVSSAVGAAIHSPRVVEKQEVAVSAHDPRLVRIRERLERRYGHVISSRRP